MTQEEKDLLLKDLCARLLYHPRINVCNDSWDGCQTGEFDTNLYSHHIDAFVCDRIEVKPYLRPMSSMTEEERNEYRKVVEKDFQILEDSLDAPVTYVYADGMIVRDKPLFNEIDWLNANHFDYRGLIVKGLALKAPEGMYKTE